MERAQALKVNVGTDPEADLGPVISKQVCRWCTWFKMFSLFYCIASKTGGL